MKAISFCLYGDLPKYCIGAIKNVALAQQFYPDWRSVVWHDKSVRPEVITKLSAMGAMMKLVPKPHYLGCFWRFLIADEGVECFLIRDTDSRIGEREVAAVNEWLDSDKSFHIMRDHPHHTRAILGGMWGCHAGVLEGMGNRIESWPHPKVAYDCDQQFLEQEIWPMAQKDSVQHDTCTRARFPGSIPFPTPLTYRNPRFVGEVFDEYDRPRDYDWEKMLNFV